MAIDPPRDRDVEAKETYAEPRRTVRKRVLWAATLKGEEGSCDCVVVDLSLGGAKLLLSMTITEGQKVALTLGRFGTFNGEVVWRRADALGVRFLDDPERIAAMIGDCLPLTPASV